MRPPSIYDQHDKAFAHVSAYVIAYKGERVATLAFKFPRDGASRLWCYLHWAGCEMVRAYAGGGGYNKRTAAAAYAACKMPAELPDTVYADGTPHHDVDTRTAYVAFRGALEKDGGSNWDATLRDAGFDVWQAV